MDLFPYQVAGATFLSARWFALLADGMGLGKSAQAVHASDLVGATRIVVVCPASVRFVWRREFQRFGKINRRVALLQHSQRRLPAAEVLVVSWDAVRSPAMLRALKDFAPEVVILDESHYAKTWDAKRTQAVFGPEGLHASARRVWCLSGTPMPNHAGELFPMLSALAPELIDFADQDDFERRYCVKRPMQVSAWTRVDRIVGSRNLDELAKRIEPFYLRRKTEDVLKDMPPIRFSVLPLDGPHEPFEPIPGDEALIEEVAESLNFAQERHAAGLLKVGPVCDLLDDEFASGLDKIVLFAWHRDVLDGLEARLRPYSPARVDGGSRDREGAVDRFQNDPSCRVFLGQILAAGTGLTLTAASHALFVEAATSPEDNAQAAKRIHRVGQTRPCFVRFAALAGSIDEAIMELTRRKTADITQVFA